MDKFTTLQQFSQSVLFNESCSGLTPGTQKNILTYRNNYILSLVHSLSMKYPVVVQLLSPGNFRYFGRNYIQANPSTSSNLDDYGSTFPEFISQQTELKSLIHLEDFAKMDWFYFSAHSSGSFIKLPKGVFDFWDGFMAGVNMEPFEIQPGFETITIEISQSKIHFLKSENSY